jgi:hypothetical protein
MTVECATANDDAALRHLLRETAMPGAISLAFAREPSYFAAATVEGHHVETHVARAHGRIVAAATRAEKAVYIDGQGGRIGYLCELRIHPDFRRGTLLARIYRQLRRLHETGQVPFYLSTIVADNDQARRTLTSGRAGLPTYRDIGAYHTLAFSPRPFRTPQLPVRRAEEADRDALLAFLQRHGPKRQFFPRYRSADFATGLLRGLRMQDVFLVGTDEILGCVALWDQSGFRQSIVDRYSRAMALARPVWNLYARVRGAPMLPRPGGEIPCLYLALPCVEDDDPAIFSALLDSALAAADRPVLAGLHERDPLLPVAARRPHRLYLSRVYQVYWEPPELLEDRVPYLELGGL